MPAADVVAQHSSPTWQVLATGRDESLLLHCIAILLRNGLSASRRDLSSLFQLQSGDAVVLVADHCARYAVDCVEKCRRSGVVLPILMATSQDLLPHITVHAFAAGGDDCVMLPFHESELVARTNALASRIPRIATDDLTPTERAILRCLHRRRGSWLSSREIIHEALGTAHAPDTALVRVHICNIRRKLASRGVQIRSRRGLGYTILETYVNQTT